MLAARIIQQFIGVLASCMRGRPRLPNLLFSKGREGTSTMINPDPDRFISSSGLLADGIASVAARSGSTSAFCQFL